MTKFRQLFQDFQPNHYDISLVLEREKRTFSGVVTIDGNLSSAPGVVRLNAKGLDVSSVSVNGHAANYELLDHDVLEISGDSVVAGTLVIVVDFAATITDSMHGLYPCYYEDGGVKKELLATQFESHSAREVFPCVDEPHAKATFDLTLTNETGVQVIGNMPVAAQSEQAGKLVTKFDTTPRMSTYLLAFVIGDLQNKSAMTKSGVEVNVWATHAQPANSLDFALDIATRTIDFFDEYFKTKYPLPKSDHIALPDFAAGAMENWGLITYRESTLLAEPGQISIASKHYVATVIAHELSHQWFGNLVTMKWWDDLWLNESFATYMEYVAIDALHPEWDMWLDFASGESVVALRRDALDGVQPVHVEVSDPDEIGTLFDGAIVYAKGARLVGMMARFVGPEAWREGLQDYFAVHKYGNTSSQDLWDALGKASGKDVGKLMNTWISQPGFPVVTLERDGDAVSLGQEQFFVGAHDDASRLWPIPIDASDPSLPELLEEKSLSATATSPMPVSLNVANRSHFITQYDEGTFDGILAELANGDLDKVSRLQLLNDQTLLARGQRISSAALLPLVKAYSSETSEPVWGLVAATLAELRKFVEPDTDEEKALKDISGSLARPLFARLGWDAEDDEDEESTKLRPLILGLMLYAEDEAAVTRATELFDSTVLDDLDSELRSLIIATKVKYAKETNMELLKSLVSAYTASTSPELRDDIVNGITAVREKDGIEYVLSLITDRSVVRHQDAARWVVYMLRSSYARDTAWKWLQEHWGWIKDTFGSDKSYGDYARYAGSTLKTRTELEEYISFFEPMKSDVALTRTITVGVSELEARVELIESDGPNVRSALLS